MDSVAMAIGYIFLAALGLAVSARLLPEGEE